ncbi:sialate O-acetylesterase [Horticoccus sp. 23ND18S-11]|uniref:sialate O-acetylesterase n=1 Tax=Horticoccus sp. 23ND18S-11 TaxID=3391832 RepID=UPI0039C9D5AD
MNVRFLSRLVLVLAGSAATAWADITLAPLFRDGAVLQRDQPLVVWGRAAAAEKVEVKFRSQTVSVITAADGRWRVTLAPEKAAIVPAELVATGANTVVVRDVLVGDVWLCSGQSNMAMMVRSSADADREIAAANFPLIRHFKVPSVVAERPASDVAGAWAVCSPTTVGTFSAAAYYFARDLHQKSGVPIGLVNSSWGGTQIEAWMSEAALRADPAGKEVYARWEARLAEYPAKMTEHAAALAKWEAAKAEAQAAGKRFARAAPAKPEGPGSRWLPGGLYNAMIAPLVPYGLRGMLWYQGETNAARHAEYASLFTGMIKQWRAEFGENLPFYFVQLANFESGMGTKGDVWAHLREAQARALTLPNTGMAVTIDVGEPKDIHPKNKQAVGRRLALHARKHVLGEKIETDGPLFTGAKPDGGAMRVTFSHAGGLKLEAPQGDGRVAFEIAGADKVFVPAEARIDGRAVIVSAASVPAPVAVRYAWRNSPDARLFNAAGLPAAPFRSDKW